MIYVHSIGRAARYYPGRTALSINGKRLTYLELHERTARIAAALIQLGFQAGDRLAILLPNESEYLALIYACSRLGVVAVPINTRYSAHEIDLVLVDAKPRGLVRHSSLPKPETKIQWERVLDEEPFEDSSGGCPEIFYDPEALLTLIYTSGTTGRPKGVMLTHANILANIHNLHYWMSYQEGGVYLHAAPMFHIADFPAMFATPAFGGCQVSLPHFSAQQFCETVARERVTSAVLVPTMINLLVQFADFHRYDLSSLTLLGYGGSPATPETIRQIRGLLPNTQLLQVYGLSETGYVTGLRNSEHTPQRMLSCGRPCPGVDLQVTDESGQPLDAGQLGELVVRGASIMHGYWGDPQNTYAAFRSAYFRTGDIGYQDTDGYFYIVDRLKDLIITGGEKVYCHEVESVICEHEAVREAAVFGIPDSKWGELVMACVVLKQEETLTSKELERHCRARLSPYKIPRRIEFLDAELPKNGTGKVLKRVLRERYWTNNQRSVA